ncbi:MAG TPA: peptidoglycan-binding domain-containing protein [Bryobacteraceae bacterium]|nr:peptidoglycan-binding domain-containing protein [Bryobacteraceae bacterium]
MSASPKLSSAQNQTGPVGHGNYTVSQGDCIESIAYEYGLFWKTVWNHPENADLRSIRGDPNRLLPGDHIYLEKTLKEVAAATDQRHCFRRKGVPSQLHVVLKQGDQPRANMPYIIDIDGTVLSATTNANGEIIHPILPNARLAKIRFGPPKAQQEIQMALGNLDPITEITGVQGRLINLGYPCGAIDGQLSPMTAAAIRAFQDCVSLPATGDVDRATRDAILQAHGS